MPDPNRPQHPDYLPKLDQAGRYYGVYPAHVIDVRDPLGQGRVKISLPWSPDRLVNHSETWARVATLMAGNNRGTWFIPDVNDEVLVSFAGGDARQPFVLGSLWSSRNLPPESMDGSGRNFRKVLRSRNGVKITLDDADGQEKFTVETPGGQKLTLKDGPGAVKIEDSNGNAIALETAGITIKSSAKVTVNASEVAVAAGLVKIDAAMTQFSGTVKCDTVICNSVVASSYTPGAGNIL